MVLIEIFYLFDFFLSCLDITIGLVCPNETAIYQLLICNLTLDQNHQNFTAILNFGDGSPEQQIELNVNSTIIKRKYSLIGYYKITAYVPQVQRYFTETVYIRRRFL